MTERIFIGVAWPYANGPLHIGHLAGAYIPPDIFARYHRMRGNHVLMVSGSDSTARRSPSRAEQARPAAARVRAPSRTTPASSTRFARLGISFDLFTTTRHRQPLSPSTQDVFRTLLANGYLFARDDARPMFDPERRALPARPLRRGDLPASAATPTRAATSATTAAARSTPPT